MKCELGKVIEMGIFYTRVLPAPDRVRIWEQFETRCAGTVRVWAKNNEMDTGLGGHYPHPNPVGAIMS